MVRPTTRHAINSERTRSAMHPEPALDRAQPFVLIRAAAGEQKGQTPTGRPRDGDEILATSLAFRAKSCGC
jgi:hypothetical protein